MQRMSGLDAGFYLLEDESTPLHVASVIVFEGPVPPTGTWSARPSAGSRSCRATGSGSTPCR
jgi:hypothetical protein